MQGVLPDVHPPLARGYHRKLNNKPTVTPKNLVLDIGNVLCRWDGPALLQQVFPDTHERELANQALVQHEDWIKLDAGLLTVDEAAERAAVRSGVQVERLIALLQTLPASLTPFADTHRAVVEVQNAGVPVYILSNMQAHCWSHLAAEHRVFDDCRGVVVSCDVQLTKPDAAIYQALTDRFSLNPEACIFVDDMPENVAAAHACGWQARQLATPSGGPALIKELASLILSGDTPAAR